MIGKSRLFVGGAEPVEQVEGLVDHPVRPCAVAVDLVDDDDGNQALRKGFLGHETRLRHGAFDRIDEQQHAVHHGQDAFDLAAKVGVPGRVHDVDTVFVPVDGRILRKDSDARSRSRSFESMIRSGASARGPNVPDCCSILSTRVVLP